LRGNSNFNIKLNFAPKIDILEYGKATKVNIGYVQRRVKVIYATIDYLNPALDTL
jgi:hypothetical protein